MIMNIEVVLDHGKYKKLMSWDCLKYLQFLI